MATACSGSGEPPAPADAQEVALGRLHAFEEARRAATDFRALPTSDEALGPDPIAVLALPGTRRLAAFLADGITRHPGESTTGARPTAMPLCLKSFLHAAGSGVLCAGSQEISQRRGRLAPPRPLSLSPSVEHLDPPAVPQLVDKSWRTKPLTH